MANPPQKPNQTLSTAPMGSGELAEALAEKDDLASENALLKARLAAIDAELAATRKRAAALPAEPNRGKVDEDNNPIFDETEPYGLCVGDHDAAYVQNGHQFGRDKRYLREEPKGSPKAFNPKLVGIVKGANPKPA